MPRGYILEEPVALSCPDCDGVMRPVRHGGLLRYRCHIGHAMTAETLLHAQLRALDYRLGACLSLLNERAELCRQMIGVAQEHGDGHASLDETRAECMERADTLRSLLESDWVTPETDGRGR